MLKYDLEKQLTIYRLVANYLFNKVNVLSLILYASTSIILAKCSKLYTPEIRQKYLFHKHDQFSFLQLFRTSNFYNNMYLTLFLHLKHIMFKTN